MNLYEELIYRGLINDISSDDLKEKLNKGGMTFYIGTDPTGDSLHIGHYSSFLISKRLANAGHHPILLVGGATGLIGDPKPSAERPMITKEQVQHNFDCLKKQATEIFGFEVVNNYDWCKDLNFIDFLREYGKYFNVSYMLAKDIIKRRLDNGITYTEFSYMIMQALDFHYLFETRNVELQVAGQDQWGNITAGIELIRRKSGKEAYGFTMPLITKSDGTKFGKSEGGAIWLDKNKTSSYAMYQFLINVEDVKVIDYLKKLTFLPKEEIEALEATLETEAHLRKPHKALAKEVITFLHGEEEYNKAVAVSEALFSGKVGNLTVEEINMGFQGVQTVEVEEDLNILDALIKTGAAKSKREAREFTSGGGVLINGVQTKDLEAVISKEKAIGNIYTIIRRGKKNYYLIKHI